MPEYIEKEKALKLIESAETWGWSNNTLYDEMKNLPAADAEPVVHAKWIYLGEGGDFNWQIDGRGQSWDIWECSNCKCKSCGSPKPKRCPHCDAKMSVEENPND